MSLDPVGVFKVIQCTYGHGVLDEFMVIQGQTLEGVIVETWINIGDLLNRLDEAEEATVKKIDGLLDMAGPFINHLDNDGLMKLSSRLLDIALVRKLMVKNLRATMAGATTGTLPPSLGERFHALAGKAA
ncbi:MAG: hypothetical protein SWK76_12025 [Actinomycetota bacterium]|nr:hypothetical protein [Actinomycetota bacterium]